MPRPRCDYRKIARAAQDTLAGDMDESYEARRMAARALGKAGDKRAIKPLLEAYETDPIIRREVVHSLRDLGVSPEEMGTFYQEATEPSLIEDLLDYVREFDLRWYLPLAVQVVPVLWNTYAAPQDEPYLLWWGAPTTAQSPLKATDRPKWWYAS